MKFSFFFKFFSVKCRHLAVLVQVLLVVGLDVREVLLAQRSAAHALSVRDEFDVHKALNDILGRKVGHVVTTNVDRSFVLIQAHNAANEARWICASNAENLEKEREYISIFA